jgi:hypothetical protein
MTHANSAGRDQRITEIAHKIWEEEGRPDGRSEDHWARAAAIVDAEALETKKPIAKKPAAKKAASAKKKA